MASPTFFARGHTPTLSDTRWFLLQRILGATVDGGGGGGAGLFTLGVVDPEGVETAVAGTGYVNTANGTEWIKESGSGNTGWKQYV